MPDTLERNSGAPYLVHSPDETVQALEQFDLMGKGDLSFSEDQLQALLFSCPNLLPVDEIDPIFGPLAPVCRELPTAAGYLDIVFINELGLLTIVECKLWRNPEARRTVVGQILDYASELSRWGYEELQNAVAGTRKETGFSLYQFLREKDIKVGKESTFIDNVSRNLGRGRFLLLIVGDGIRERVETISDFLQHYAHLNFTFGLVETTIYRLPPSLGRVLLIQPRVLAKTVEIERAVVRLDEHGVVVEAPSFKESISRSASRRTNITEQYFYESIAKLDPDLPHQIESFIARVKKSGLIIDPTKSALMIKTADKKFNFAALQPDGNMRNYGIVWRAEEIGHVEIGEMYLEKLASLLPATTVAKPRDKFEWTVQKQDGSFVTISECLEVQDEWLILIKDTLDWINHVLNEG